MIPKKHQQEILNQNPKKYLLAFDTGTGKTLTALLLARQNDQQALIIVPKKLKEQWQKNLFVQEDGHFVVTKEEFKKLANENNLLDYNCIIVDEAHFFAGIKSQLSKSLYRYVTLKNPEYVWLLTATPYLSTPWNIYTLAKILGHDWSYKTFQKRFFHEVLINGRYVLTPKTNIENDIAFLVSKIGTAVSFDEVAESDGLQTPDQTHDYIYVDPTQEQKDLFQEQLTNEFANIVLWTKLHQIENQVINSDGYSDSVMIEDKDSQTKLRYVLKYVAENKKLAIICRYNLQIEMYKKHIQEMFPSKIVLVINGKTTDNHSTVTLAENSDDVVVLIQAQCSEGYELPSIPLCVFASMSFSYKDYKQMLGRFLRINKMKANTYVYLLSKPITKTYRKSIDQAVVDSLHKKQDFNLSMYKKQ